MRPLERLVLRFAAAFALVALAPRAASAEPLDPKVVPEPLKPWVAWALDTRADAFCPTFLGHADLSRCAWPSRLELAVEEHRATFTQHWHVDATRWVPVPGDDKRWPVDVKVDGARAVVIPQAGIPSVSLKSGDHAVAGSFVWDSPPESLRVPPETGLLALTLRGSPIAWPNRDAQGTVWLQKAATNQEGDALELVVHRKISDDIPLLLTTRVELHVAGKSREELLGKALPEGFVPMALTSPLPARVEPDGRIRVQVRPGIHVLELAARSEGEVRSLTRPAPQGPWRDGEEVWVFEARNDYRIVTVTGVPSIDPQQTTLPDAWKRLPAYPVKIGARLGFEEKRRGDADPPPDQLTLARTLWLDFDGTGYTASDRLSGTLQRDTRLTMAEPTVLGRVAIGGRDQFITHMAGSPLSGVEVRQGELSAAADSRIPGEPDDVPAVGWAHDFHQVSAKLHLPPGWRLLHASGVDEVQGTWVKRWTLLELFLALLVAIGIGRLYGGGWGVVAALMLFLTIPEPNAPQWSWLFVLAAEALVRVLPAGTARKLFEGVRLATIAVVAVIAVPFLVQHVREGLFPALASESSSMGAAADVASTISREVSEPEEEKQAVRAKGDEGSMGAANAPAPAASKAAPAAGAPTGRGASALHKEKDYRQSNAPVYDPNAMVQTGPGVPEWQWSTLDLRWSGPVAAAQRLHLYLLSPHTNLALALLRAALLIVLVLRLLPWTRRLVSPLGLGAAGAIALVLAPTPARADIPDAPTLQELAERLTRKPECAPTCASSGRMAIEVRAASLRARVQLDASAPTAVPLPGASGEWTPASVALDGQPARALLRTDDGVLWIELAAGVHEIVLDSPMPDRDSVQLPLRMKPHRVEVSADGWAVAGVHEDGLADDDLQLTRTRKQEADAGASLQPGTLPPFVRVERTLHAGLDWQVDTLVVRASPQGAAVVLEVPLLAGESVTTPDVRVEGGKALVNMAARATQVAWHSVLEQRSPVTLVAPRSLSWMEVWRVDVGPIWHATLAGIPAVHTQATGGTSVPEWRPWPGEKVTVELVRPDGAAGQTLTIDESTTEIRPGQRATDTTLTLRLRSSRGGEHTITLPEDAQLESLSINGATQPVRQQGSRVTFPIVPGAQTVTLTWREARGLSTRFASSAIDLGEPSVNARLTMAVPGAQWLLFAGGPRVGPAVLFWSLLLVLLVVSLVLGANRWTPLRWWHWLLLSIGLSQVSVVAGAVFVGWLLALGWRARLPAERDARLFNLTQVLLALLTLSALGILAVSLYQGLLGSPEMQVRGNGSTAAQLQWFTDRSGPRLPSAWMVSVPLLAYRGAMLGWALWIALALLGWLRWGWGAFTEGSGWRKAPPRPMPVMHPPAPPVPPAPPPPPPAATA